MSEAAQNFPISVPVIKPWRTVADIEGMQERRSEARMLCADMVEITWRDGLGKAGRGMALLEDISISGACLQLDSAVPIAAEVHWKSPKQEFAGVVRYCVYREIGYFVGVEFSPSSKWSKKIFKPQHLLDLQQLAQNFKGKR